MDIDENIFNKFQKGIELNDADLNQVFKKINDQNLDYKKFVIDDPDMPKEVKTRLTNVMQQILFSR